MTRRAPLLFFGSALLLSISAASLAACDDPAAPVTTPAIRVADQYLVSDRVMVARAVADEAGWVVIQHQESGAPPRLLGTARLETGTHENLEVRLHEEAVEEMPKGSLNRVWGVLYRDGGRAGVLEIEGEEAPDQPLLQDGREVAQPFFLYRIEAIPESHIYVNDQDMGQGYILLEEVKMSEPGDVVIHRSKGNTPLVPGIIGILPLDEGVHQNVKVPLFADERVACREQLWPMLHVRSVSDDQPYNLDQPIITVPVVRTCEESVDR